MIRAEEIVKQNYTGRRRLSREDYDRVIEKIFLLEDQAESEKKELSGHQIIQNAKEIYLASSIADIGDDERNSCKTNYLKSLIKYGYTAKGEWEQSGQIALRLFQDALQVENRLPIAHYRIGHILFKKEKYAKAVLPFYSAISLMHNYSEKNFGLNESQLLNAKKVLSFCALSVFADVKEDSLRSEMYPQLDGEIKKYMSKQFEVINGKIITVRRIKDKSIAAISLNDYNEYLLETENQNVIVINGYEKRLNISFKENSTGLSERQLKLLLDIIDEDYDDPLNYINSSEPKRNSFNQSLVRLRDKFAEIDLNEDLIKLKKIENFSFRATVITDLEILIFRRIED